MNQKDRLIAIVENWEQVCASQDAEIKRLREENKMLTLFVEQLRHGINDAISMGSSGARTPAADGSIKHYFPLYLLEMIE